MRKFINQQSFRLCSGGFSSLLILIISAGLLLPHRVSAQVESPDKKHLFEEDSKELKAKKEQAQKALLKSESAEEQVMNLKAPEVRFDQERHRLIGEGGVLLTYGEFRAEAERGSVDTVNKEARLEGDVRISGLSGAFSSQAVNLNLNTETGTFEQVDFTIPQGSFGVSAERMNKIGETQYELDEAEFSTCHCKDGSKPWSIDCSSASVTQGGYAHTYGSKLKFNGVPVFYTPYLGFPVKSERSSGLLPGDYGYNKRDGLQLSLPLYLVPDDYSDLIVRPFIASNTRTGVGLDYRRLFSLNNKLSSEFIYSDESKRGDDLRGTYVDDLYDKEFDKDRFGLYYNQQWRADRDAALPLELISDVHYVSDDLFLRELDNKQIGDRQIPFTTSSVALRSNIVGSWTAESALEYNQALDDTNDDLMFQRLPELSLGGLERFSPFGINPYGLKLLTKVAGTATNFSRQEGYEGWRTDVAPRLAIPMHLQNFFATEASIGMHKTNYALDDRTDPEVANRELESSYDRSIYDAQVNIGSAVERVYDLPEQNILSDLSGLGSLNQYERLTRMKHVIEPNLSYLYVPDVDQDENPTFDSFDRINRRSLATFSLANTLYGRYLPTEAGSSEIPELVPRVQSLPPLKYSGFSKELDELSLLPNMGSGSSKRLGSVRELMTLNFTQSYDQIEAREDLDPNFGPWRDLQTDLGFYPSKNLALFIQSTYNVPDSNPSSWHFGTSFRDDRGDLLRARYSYINDSEEYLEGNAQIALMRRLGLGYFTRYDRFNSEFLENRIALRVSSACDCWNLDFGFRDAINPDKQSFIVNFTFGGLGSISQDILYKDKVSQNGALAQ